MLDFAFIDDVILGIVTLIERISKGEKDVLNQCYNIVSGEGTSIVELARLIKEVTKSESQIIIDKKSFVAYLFKPLVSLILIHGLGEG